MVYTFYRLTDMDLEQLAALYELDSVKSQNRFFEILEETFFSLAGARYCVLVDNRKYIAALRLEHYADGWLLSGLQVHPAHRRQGHGLHLVRSSINDYPTYSHIRHGNLASIALHLRAGFVKTADTARLLDGTVTSSHGTYSLTDKGSLFHKKD